MSKRLIELNNISKSFGGNIVLDEFDLYFNKYVDQGMPLVSHSEIYKNLYDPHYRVIHKKYFILEGENNG